VHTNGITMQPETSQSSVCCYALFHTNDLNFNSTVMSLNVWCN